MVRVCFNMNKYTNNVFERWSTIPKTSLMYHFLRADEKVFFPFSRVKHKESPQDHSYAKQEVLNRHISRCCVYTVFWLNTKW